jgi:hypothetical protein
MLQKIIFYFFSLQNSLFFMFLFLELFLDEPATVLRYLTFLKEQCTHDEDFRNVFVWLVVLFVFIPTRPSILIT